MRFAAIRSRPIRFRPASGSSRRSNEVEGIIEEVDVVEPVVRAEDSPIVVHADRPTVKLEHDRKVELPCLQPGEVLVRLAVGDVDLDAGVQRVEPFHCASEG